MSVDSGISKRIKTCACLLDAIVSKKRKSKSSIVIVCGAETQIDLELTLISSLLVFECTPITV